MEKLFHLKERGTTVGKEIIGGITTFLAMAYILAVNPGILSASGMDFNAVFTATAISASIATLVMAFIANLPVALAPGLGLNAFFTYSVVQQMGCTWQFALTAVFVEGLIFILLSVFGVVFLCKFFAQKAIEKLPALNFSNILVSLGIGFASMFLIFITFLLILVYKKLGGKMDDLGGA